MHTLDMILKNMANAAASSPLAAKAATLMGASKGQSGEVVTLFIAKGLTHFGENRVQEAQEKWPALKKAYPDITLHLIGPLQTNKVEGALEIFDVIQTLDRKKLIDEIAKHPLAKSKRYFVQVNIGEEEQKSGISPADTKALVNYAREKGLNVVGLMCVPPAEQMPAPHFALLKKLADENGLKELSMGMSGDFETAIRMGSTCVRIGTALFGERT